MVDSGDAGGGEEWRYVDWVCLDDILEQGVEVMPVCGVVGSVYYAPKHVHCES